MKAYLLVRVIIEDREAYGEYMRHTPRLIADHGGKMIVRGGEVETVEGDPETHRLVIIEFPSKEAARRFYESDAYQAAKRLREGAGEAQFVIVDGYPEATWNEAVDLSRQLAP